jgi:DNA-binding response OmpR family regulator
VSRVLIHEPRHSGDECSKLLTGEGHEIVVCQDRASLFEALAAHRPDVVVYVLGDLALDLSVLSFLRRMAATLPLILLGGPAGLEARRSVQELRPTYYGVFPLEPAELSDAVNGAINHRNGHARA